MLSESLTGIHYFKVAIASVRHSFINQKSSIYRCNAVAIVLRLRNTGVQSKVYAVTFGV